MSANRIPEFPDYLDNDLSHMTGYDLLVEVQAYGRACYLAGLAAAKQVVPASANDCGEVFFNDFRNQALANITALEKEAGK